MFAHLAPISELWVFKLSNLSFKNLHYAMNKAARFAFAFQS